jgi:hypothetical protein
MTVYNDSPLTATIDVGLITFNVPADWIVTVTPSPTVEVAPYSSAVLKISVTIPCAETIQALSSARLRQSLQAQSNGVPTIDVEGYNKGVLVGGVELRFPSAGAPSRKIFLPLVRR